MKAKSTTHKPIEILEADRAELKNVKVYKKVHKALKSHVALSEENISEFVSQAIIEKLSR